MEPLRVRLRVGYFCTIRSCRRNGLFNYGGGYDPYYGGGGGYSSETARAIATSAIAPQGEARERAGPYRRLLRRRRRQLDGTLQRLRVEAGNHRVELKADGYEPVAFDVMIIPGDTITYKGEMKRR